MESQSLEQHTDTRPIPVYIASARDESDEISLIDFWRIVVGRKAIVFISLFFSMLLAFAYLYFSEPLYKANAHLLPPQHKNIQELFILYRDVVGVDINPITPELVFQSFLKNLESQGLRHDFFESYHLLEHYTKGGSTADVNADRVFDALFNNRLNVHTDKQDAAFVTVSFSDSDPQMAAKFLNQIIAFANKHTVEQLSSSVTAAIQSESTQVRHQMDSKLKLAEKRRLDRIETLKEALRVARTLNIRDTSSFPKMAENAPVELAVITAQAPLYMRGAEALETEIAVLESRKSEEPFIGGLRDLQERQAFLGNISLDSGTFSAVTVDSLARVPYKAEKPRKLLTILLALVLGIMVGVFSAFIATLLQATGKESTDELPESR